MLVTSVNPLRIYLYDDGLVRCASNGNGSLLLFWFAYRFASNKYSNESAKVGDVFTHLTNYSINKNSTTYMSNEDSTQAQVNLGLLDTIYAYYNCVSIRDTNGR